MSDEIEDFKRQPDSVKTDILFIELKKLEAKLELIHKTQLIMAGIDEKVTAARAS